MDAFNVFTHTQFSGINSVLSFSGTTVTNQPYNSNGTLNKTDFGTVSAA
jgi:hypothetical protein